MKKESFFKTQKLFFLTALIISLVFFDQFSKYLIEANFNLYESTNIIPFLNFTFIKNFGGAFNLFNDASLNLGLIFILLVSLICFYHFPIVVTSPSLPSIYFALHEQFVKESSSLYYYQLFHNLHLED